MKERVPEIADQRIADRHYRKMLFTKFWLRKATPMYYSRWYERMAYVLLWKFMRFTHMSQTLGRKQAELSEWVYRHTGTCCCYGCDRYKAHMELHYDSKSVKVSFLDQAIEALDNIIKED